MSPIYTIFFINRRRIHASISHIWLLKTCCNTTITHMLPRYDVATACCCWCHRCSAIVQLLLMLMLLLYYSARITIARLFSSYCFYHTCPLHHLIQLDLPTIVVVTWTIIVFNYCCINTRALLRLLLLSSTASLFNFCCIIFFFVAVVFIYYYLHLLLPSSTTIIVVIFMNYCKCLFHLLLVSLRFS